MTDFVTRIRGYLGEMFSVPLHLFVSVLVYASVALYARHVHQVSTSLFSIHGAIGVWNVFSTLLILRLMDELKDEDIDRRLFPHRPLPSGRVLRSDIQRSLAVVVVLFVVVNLLAGWAFFVAVGVVAYTFLMFRRFFAPALLSRNLPLTLATHNPVTALVLLHAVAVFGVEHNLVLADLRWGAIIPFIIMMWMPFTAWEFARKIRAPEEEDEYVTYSQILGARGAVWVTWVAQTITLAIAAYLWCTLGLHWFYLIIVVGGAGFSAWAGIRFLLHPTPETSQLRPAASAFVISVAVAQIVGFAGVWQWLN
jgi:4-hydroxybenzoate polyprenyltransferase